jgi:hypothetical protein
VTDNCKDITVVLLTMLLQLANINIEKSCQIFFPISKFGSFSALILYTLIMFK